jgi:hypothetical protein
MTKSLTPVESDSGWVINMTPEMTQLAGVDEGSQIIFYITAGEIAAEILPPPTQELKDSAQRIADKFKDAFAEMKRLGD